MAVPSNSVLEGLKKLRNDSSLADFTLVSETGREWKVHKVVIGFHSDVLYRMATSELFWECQNDRVILKGFNNECIDTLVEYMYDLKVRHIDYKPHNDLVDETENDHHGFASVSFYAGIFRLGDMYNIAVLLDKAMEGFKEWYAVDGLEIDSVDYVFEAIALVNEFPAQMWTYMVKHMADEITEKGHWHNMDEIRTLFKKYPAFAVDVVSAVAEKNHEDNV